MKHFIFTLLISIISFQISASDLVLIPTSNYEHTKELFSDSDITVHFYRNEFVVASTNKPLEKEHYILDTEPWQEDMSYYLVYTDKHVNKDEYLQIISSRSEVLHDGDFFLIVRTNEKQHGQLPPAKNDGMVRIFERESKLPVQKSFSYNVSSEPEQYILDLMAEVSSENVTSQVQHLEDYITRNAYHQQSIEAQQWIKEQFTAWGLEVEEMEFTMPEGASSDNVIATLTGTEYPDEYVVLGGHYDSYSYDGDAPGADDNASGTSGVMEIARILSQHEFERSIIFCAFSGEEYGLYGSAAYAARSSDEEMNILGYFNMDMIGYLEPGHTTYKSSLIYPASAQPLADFYTDICEVYLPDFAVEPDSFTAGDSDHTSFNNNGYMGIFPFEDADYYSPYIHTSDDLVGPSYNNEDQAVVFTQAVLASVVTLAKMEPPAVDITEIQDPEYSNVFPNPASDYISININSNTTTELIIKNIAGQIIVKRTISDGEKINISSFPAGIYLFEINGDNFVETHKVILQ
ncbi:MAG: M28 family peptidase [Bacteroidales bacterium]